MNILLTVDVAPVTGILLRIHFSDYNVDRVNGNRIVTVKIFYADGVIRTELLLLD